MEKVVKSTSENEAASHITLRRATVADYKAVMDILPDVYDGLDYLPHLYYTFFQRNRHVAYLVEDNGLAVSFVIVELSQENSVATLMAVRTRRSHQGQGLSVSKNKALRSLILADNPSIKKEALTLKIQDCNEKLRHQTEMVLHLKIDAFSTGYEETKECLRRYKMTSPHHHHILSYQQCIHLLNETNDFENFITQYSPEYITSDENGRLVRINKIDLKLVFATSTVCVTFADDVRNSPISGSDMPHQDRKIAALSYAILGLTDSRVDLSLHYFGDMSNMADHVALQLNNICERSCNVHAINFFLMFPMSLEYELVSEKIEKLGLTRDKAIGYVNRAELGTVIRDFII